MERDAATSAKIAALRKQLESISGQQIDASDEQLIDWPIPVSLISLKDGTVMSKGIFTSKKNCLSTSAYNADVFEVSSSYTTDASGQRTFLLSDYLCSTINSFTWPISLVVTPNTSTPCYATMTRTVVTSPNGPSYNDVQIVVHTWSTNGQPAPNISFDWWCRLLSVNIIT